MFLESGYLDWMAIEQHKRLLGAWKLQMPEVDADDLLERSKGARKLLTPGRHVCNKTDRGILNREM